VNPGKFDKATVHVSRVPSSRTATYRRDVDTDDIPVERSNLGKELPREANADLA
jgi:hypothetical protein